MMASGIFSAGPDKEHPLGIRVERATATLPQTGAGALFTVGTGRILIMGIVGEVTTEIETQGNATKLTANPTTGPSADICATLNITGDTVGTLYGITGTFGDALVGAGAAGVFCSTPVVLDIGTLDLDCAASNSGSVLWVAYYVPLESGASLVSA